MSQYQKAILTRVTGDGLGYLVDDRSNKVFAFTFDKIPDYRGQSLKELGICAGALVMYDLDDAGYVSHVELISTKKKRWTLPW